MPDDPTDQQPTECGFDAAEYHCYRCGGIVTGTSRDPEAFGRLVAEHRATCPQVRAAALPSA